MGFRRARPKLAASLRQRRRPHERAKRASTSGGPGPNARAPLEGRVGASLSLRGLEDALQLLSQHHVSLDLELAAHESLHAIELAVRHGDHVRVCHYDGAVQRVVLAEGAAARSILEVQRELAITPSVADDELEHG